MNNKIIRSLQSCFLIFCLLHLSMIGFIPLAQADQCSGPDVEIERNKCTERNAGPSGTGNLGYTFDSSSCRCVNTQDKEETRDQFLKCKDESAYPTPEARRTCMEANAQGQMTGNIGYENGDTAAAANDWAGGISGIVMGIATAVALYNFVGATDTMAGSCLSRTLFSAVAILAFAAEIMSYFFLESKLRDLSAEYASYVAAHDDNETTAMDSLKQTKAELASTAETKNPFEAQKIAFDYLVREQDTIAEVAGTKKWGYTIAAVGFGAAMIIALVEIAFPQALRPCLYSEGSFLPGQENNIVRNINPLDLYIAHKNLLLAKGNLTVSEELANIAEIKSIAQGENRSMTIEQFNNLKSLDLEFGSNQFGENFSLQEQHSVFKLIKSTILSQAYGEENLYPNGPTGPVEDPKLWVMIIGAGGGLVTGIVMAAAKPVRKALTTSIAISILSGVEAVLNTVLAYYAFEQERIAKINSAIAAQIRDKFMDGIAAYCPMGRENLADPNCYCYTEDGKKNPNRTNSDTCKALWASNESNFFVKGKSDKNGEGGDIIGCMTVNRQFDAECKCKKFVDKKSGKNACFSVPVTSSSLGGIGGGIGLGSTIDDLNNLANGNLNKGNINGSNLNQRATRQRELAKQMLKKINDKRIGNKLAPLDLSKKALSAFVNNTLPKELLKLAQTNGFGAGVPGDRPNVEALKEAIAKTGLDKKFEYAGGGGNKKAGEEKKGFNFDFENQGGQSGDAKIMDEFMEKKYNFKDNDIVKNNDASIWQVISNRYTQSALPRLFATEAEMKAIKEGTDVAAPPKTEDKGAK